MKGVPITDEMRDEIVAMSKVGGFSVDDIAEEVGSSATTVARVLAAINAESLSMDDGDDDSTKRAGSLEASAFVQIAEEYKRGDQIAEICDKNRITVQQLYSVLRECGIPTRAQEQQRARVARMDDAINMYVGGSPLWEINTATEISTFALNREIHRRGIPLRRPRKLVS